MSEIDLFCRLLIVLLPLILPVFFVIGVIIVTAYKAYKGEFRVISFDKKIATKDL